MKILFVTPFVGYSSAPYAGELVIYNLMKGLSSRGHELYLITGMRRGDRDHLDEIKPYCTVLEVIDTPWTRQEIVRDVVRWVLRGFRGGLTVRARAAAAVAKYSKEIAFDVIQVEYTEMGEFIVKPGSVPIIIAAVDVLLKPALREYERAQGMRKIVKYLAYRRTVAREIALYRKFDLVFTFSDFDRQLLASYAPDLKIATRLPQRFTGAVDGSRQSDAILFVGAMDRPVNIQAALFFAREVFPLVRKVVPGASFYIVGSNPTPEVKALSDGSSNIIVTGFVDDLKPFYAKARVSVAPLFIGGGIITKILDSMAIGVPVITTAIGNEGVNAEPGTDLIIASTADEFAAVTVQLMQDNMLWQKLVKNGKTFIAKHFAEDEILSKIEQEYRALQK